MSSGFSTRLITEISRTIPPAPARMYTVRARWGLSSRRAPGTAMNHAERHRLNHLVHACQPEQMQHTPPGLHQHRRLAPYASVSSRCSTRTPMPAQSIDGTSCKSRTSCARRARAEPSLSTSHERLGAGRRARESSLARAWPKCRTDRRKGHDLVTVSNRHKIGTAGPHDSHACRRCPH